MEEANSCEDQTSEILPSTLDVGFCKFYHQVIENLLSDVDEYVSWKRYLDAIRRAANSWCEFENTKDQRLLEKFMNSPYYRLTYVYKNSTLLSSAVAFHFENILKGSPDFLEKLLSKRQIKICSLGCGPGSDVVALINVLDSISEKFHVQLDISVTVIDVDSDWENTCLSVLRHLKSTIKTNIRTQFIQADLSKFYTHGTVDAIQEADIVVMVKTLSEFLGSFYDSKYIFKVLNELMQPGAMLFILDRPKKNFIRVCGNYSGLLAGFGLIYEEAYDLHVLDIDAIAKAFYLYYRHIENRVFNTCLKIFVRAWVKTHESNEEIPSEHPINDFVHNRFVRNREKYDARHYLNDEIFQLLENNFVEKISGLGMDRNSFESYVADQRRLRNDLYSSFHEKLCALDSVQKTIHDEIRLTGEFSLESWEKFIKCKMDVSFLKRAIYCELVISFRGCLKWEDGVYNVEVHNWRERMVNAIPDF